MSPAKSRPKRVRPAWLDGPLVLAGNWEPLIFRQRLGGGPAEVAARYAAEHTAEAAAKLAAAGVTLLITHWYKGFGLAAEGPDMDAARELIGHCHDHDIRVAGYVGDTFMPETFLLEEPAAATWCQRQQTGDPVEYGGIQTWRHKWCRENPAYLPFMQTVLRQGIEAGLDMIHFDNFLDKPAPLKCHCEHCTQAFRDYLRQRYTAAERRDILGFAAVEAVALPRFGLHLYRRWWARDHLKDPLLRAAVDWRCESVAAAYRKLGDYCRSLRPDIVIECNPTGIWGENSAWMRSIDHARLLPDGDFFWDESPNPHGLLPNGALSTNLRSMKLGEATGNRTFFYAHEADDWANGLKLGEALAANDGCLGRIADFDGATVRATATGRDAAAFLREHCDLLIGTRSLARVGVYRQFTSLAADAWEPHLQTLLAEQALLQGHIPFDIVLDLADADRYEALVLAGLDCLDDREVAALEALAAAGVSLLLAGTVGTADAWGRTRPSPAPAAAANIHRLPRLELPPEAPQRGDRQLWDDDYPVIDGRFRCRPANAAVLLDYAPAPLAVEAPPTVLVEPRLAVDDTLLLHILQYEPGTATVTVQDLTAPAVRLLTPNAPARTIPATAGLDIETDAPYTLAVIASQPQ